MISGAPWSFALLVSLTVTLSWIAVRAFYKQESAAAKQEAAKARVDLTEDRLKVSERILREQRPAKTAFSDLTNQALLDRAMDLAFKLRRYQDEEEARIKQLREYDEAVRPNWGNPEDYNRRASAKEAEQQERLDRHFQTHFKIDAILLRNEILERLPLGDPPGGIWGPGGEYRIDLSAYDKMKYVWQLEVLGRHLEGIGKLLPINPPADSPGSTSCS